jgi:hypothetical protein
MAATSYPPSNALAGLMACQTLPWCMHLYCPLDKWIFYLLHEGYETINNKPV